MRKIVSVDEKGGRSFSRSWIKGRRMKMEGKKLI